MSIDSTFKPQTGTYLVGVTAVQIVEAFGSGVVSFRVWNNAATIQYLTWGRNSGITAAGAPTAGVPSVNTIGIPIGAVVYVEVPANSYFIGNTGSAFQITGGEGGNGG